MKNDDDELELEELLNDKKETPITAKDARIPIRDGKTKDDDEIDPDLHSDWPEDEEAEDEDWEPDS